MQCLQLTEQFSHSASSRVHAQTNKRLVVPLKLRPLENAPCETNIKVKAEYFNFVICLCRRRAASRPNQRRPPAPPEEGPHHGSHAGKEL